jgi:hypothetical protein
VLLLDTPSNVLHFNAYAQVTTLPSVNQPFIEYQTRGPPHVHHFYPTPEQMVDILTSHCADYFQLIVSELPSAILIETEIAVLKENSEKEFVVTATFEKGIDKCSETSAWTAV